MEDFQPNIYQLPYQYSPHHHHHHHHHHYMPSQLDCASSKVPKRQIVCQLEQFNRILGSYSEDIHLTHLENEEKFWKEKPHDSLSNQMEVNPQMRAILVDWLGEVTDEYSLNPDTFFLAVNYIDRVLATRMVARSALQLLGVSCMLIACKYEEIHAPVVEDFVYITDSTYTREQILQTELVVLNALNFSLTVSTIRNFLPRFLLAGDLENPQAVLLSNYLSELVLAEYSIIHQYKPSQIAASIVCICRATLLPHQLALTPFLEKYSGYSKATLRPCINEICRAHMGPTNATGKSPGAREKYRDAKYLCISSTPLQPIPFL